MANDADWVSDVRRWYFAREQAKQGAPEARAEIQLDDFGYEAAHPVLQSRHWPEAPTTGFADFK